MKTSLLASTVLTVGLLASAAAAQTSSPTKPHDQCFRSHDYQSFRPVDEHAFNIRVNVNEFYRIELEGTCPELMTGNPYLITQVRGSDLICGPLDWDLKIGQNGEPGFVSACIVKSQRRLTPAEVAAMPRNQKP